MAPNTNGAKAVLGRENVTIVGTMPGPLTGDVVYVVRHGDDRTSSWLRPFNQSIPDVTGSGATTLRRR